MVGSYNPFTYEWNDLDCVLLITGQNSKSKEFKK